MSNNSASWLVFELRRTLGAMALFAVAMVFLYSTFFPLNPEYPPPPIVGVIAGVFAAASFRQIVQGGCRLDTDAGVLSRWWGPLFPVRTRRIRLDFIRAVVVTGGAKSRIDGGTWFSVAVQTHEGIYLVKALRQREATMGFAETLSRVTQSTLVDQTTA